MEIGEVRGCTAWASIVFASGAARTVLSAVGARFFAPTRSTRSGRAASSPLTNFRMRSPVRLSRTEDAAKRVCVAAGFTVVVSHASPLFRLKSCCT
jgi:hypothetical protein